MADKVSTSRLHTFRLVTAQVNGTSHICLPRPQFLLAEGVSVRSARTIESDSLYKTTATSPMLHARERHVKRSSSPGARVMNSLDHNLASTSKAAMVVNRIDTTVRPGPWVTGSM